MDGQRFCSYEGHQNSKCLYICTHKDCSLRRWVCGECLRLQLHLHGEQKELQHIMNHEEFIKFFTNQINPLKCSIYRQYSIARQVIDYLNHIIELFRNIIIQLQTDIHNIWIYNDMINLQALQEQVKNDFYTLEGEQIIRIQQLNLLENCYEFKVLKEIIAKVNTQVEEFSQKVHLKQQDIQKTKDLIDTNKQSLQRQQSLFKRIFDGIPKLLENSKLINVERSQQNTLLKSQNNYELAQCNQSQMNNDQSQLRQQSVNKLIQSDIQNNQFRQIEQVQDFKIYFDYQQENCINTSALSQNEKILAISDHNRLQIYDVTSLINNFILELDSEVSICKFGKDSQLLFCGDVEGNLYSFQTTNNFKLQYKFRVHKSQINNLIIINDQNVLTSSEDQTIKISNVKFNRVELLIENSISVGLDHNKYINVICNTNSKQINFYNGGNRQLIFKRDYKDVDTICQIQFVKENKLISRSQIRFIQWQIDYSDKWMAKVRVFKYEIGILNIFSGLKDTRILIVTTFYSEIYDDKLDFIQRIDHDSKYRYYDNYTCQIDSLNYILVPSQNQLQALKRSMD